MSKQIILFPTFDGQTKAIAAISAEAIDLIKPGMTPGTTNVYVTGNHGTNCVNVYMDMKLLLEKLKEAGVSITDLSGGQGYSIQRDDGH